MIPLIESKPTTFGNLKKFEGFVADQEKTKRTVETQFKDWAVTDTGLKVQGEEYPMRDHAMRQLLRTLEMPVRFYMDKAPTDMAVRDINRMRDEYTEDSEMQVFLQKNNGQPEVRGVADPNFQAIRYPKVISRLKVKEGFKEASYSDWGIRITTTDKTDLIKVQKNDIVEIGNDLVYSDVNSVPFVGSPFFLRLACTNGMVVREATDLVHSFRMRSTVRIEQDAWLQTLGENCRAITVNSKKIATVFKIMRDEPMEALDGADNFMRQVKSRVGAEVFNSDEELTKEIKDGDKKKRVIDLGVTIYAALAAVTVLAKTLAFVERRRLEIHAGTLVARTIKAVKVGRIRATL